MNRKRARKIAEQRMPTLQQVETYKRRAEQAEAAVSMLCVSVARLGGVAEFTADELRTAPMVSVRTLEGGGVRLAIQRTGG